MAKIIFERKFLNVYLRSLFEYNPNVTSENRKKNGSVDVFESHLLVFHRPIGLIEAIYLFIFLSKYFKSAWQMGHSI